MYIKSSDTSKGANNETPESKKRFDYNYERIFGDNCKLRNKEKECGNTYTKDIKRILNKYDRQIRGNKSTGSDASK